MPELSRRSLLTGAVAVAASAALPIPTPIEPYGVNPLLAEMLADNAALARLRREVLSDYMRANLFQPIQIRRCPPGTRSGSA